MGAIQKSTLTNYGSMVKAAIPKAALIAGVLSILFGIAWAHNEFKPQTKTHTVLRKAVADLIAGSPVDQNSRNIVADHFGPRYSDDEAMNILGYTTSELVARIREGAQLTETDKQHLDKMRSISSIFQ